MPEGRGGGIRQGGPLFPYLFLICAEGFTALLKKAERNRLLSGVKIAKDSPTLTHIFFADCSLLFYKAIAGEARILMKIFETYGRASGQTINIDKSFVFFRKNTTQEEKQQVIRELKQMQVVTKVIPGTFIGYWQNQKPSVQLHKREDQ